MKAQVFAIAAGLLALAAPIAAAAGPAARYESTVLAGTPQVGVTFFKIEVATGRVWMGQGLGPLALSVDKAPIPAGDYHLSLTSLLQTDGKQYWNLYRFESQSGRVWIAGGGGTEPLSWTEVMSAK